MVDGYAPIRELESRIRYRTTEDGGDSTRLAERARNMRREYEEAKRMWEARMGGQGGDIGGKVEKEEVPVGVEVAVSADAEEGQGGEMEKPLKGQHQAPLVDGAEDGEPAAIDRNVEVEGEGTGLSDGTRPGG